MREMTFNEVGLVHGGGDSGGEDARDTATIVGNTLKGALEGAAAGAVIGGAVGTFVAPAVGTAAGAAVGAVAFGLLGAIAAGFEAAGDVADQD